MMLLGAIDSRAELLCDGREVLCARRPPWRQTELWQAEPVIVTPDEPGGDERWMPIDGDTPRGITLSVRRGACIWFAYTYNGKRWFSTTGGRTEEVYPTHWWKKEGDR